MATITEKELNGLRMGVIDLYRQYCPEFACDDIELLLRKINTEQPLFRMSTVDDKDTPDVRYSIGSEKNDNIPSLHEDHQPFVTKRTDKSKNLKFSLVKSQDKELEQKIDKLAKEAEVRKASTYQKLEKLPDTETSKSTCRNRLVEKRKADYSLFERIGFWIDNILGKTRPKTIQYTEAFNEIPLAPTFSEMLMNLIQEKHLENAEVYKKAQLDKRLFSKIISNQFYNPSRETVFSFIIALQLDMEEANDLLATAGYAFKKNSITDVVVEYFIRTRNYDLFQLNEVLNSLNQKTLSR